MIFLVGCNVVAHVTSAGVLSDTHRGRQCELFTKKGGITKRIASSFYKGGAFLISANKQRKIEHANMAACRQYLKCENLTSNANEETVGFRVSAYEHTKKGVQNYDSI